MIGSVFVLVLLQCLRGTDSCTWSHVYLPSARTEAECAQMATILVPLLTPRTHLTERWECEWVRLEQMPGQVRLAKVN